MSITWTYLQEKPQEAKPLIGISYEQLMQLIAIAKKLDKNYQEKIEKEKIRLICLRGKT